MKLKNSNMIYHISFFGCVFPKMREAVMKEEKLRISAHPSTTEASNTIHLHELMMPPPLLHHIITPKKLMIALTQPPLLPEEIGGKVYTVFIPSSSLYSIITTSTYQ